MIGRESARHFFRFLTCRRIDIDNLDGIIEDYACGVHPYLLNREVEDYKYKLFLGRVCLKSKHCHYIISSS